MEKILPRCLFFVMAGVCTGLWACGGRDADIDRVINGRIRMRQVCFTCTRNVLTFVNTTAIA